MFLALVFFLLGTALFLIGLNQFIVKGQIAITNDTVLFSKKNIFGKKEWREFLVKYEGVLYRSEYHAGSKNRSSYTLYIIELKHSDPKKKLLLYQSRSAQDTRQKWESYSRALKLSALEMSQETIVKREVGDLDKSVKDLIGEGKIRIDKAVLARIPEGIEIKNQGRNLIITVTKKRLSLPLLISAQLFIIIFIGLPFFAQEAAFMFTVIGLFFEMIFLAVIAWVYFFKSQLLILNEELSVSYLSRWGNFNGGKLERKSIEQVRIKSTTDNINGNKIIVIESDFGNLKFGQGLPDDSLRWLANFIIDSLS
ncbi:MAG: hypothetical protein PHV17_05755 [Candidatus Omnitrophica bacterium]|nr:hypothetical protein [Candidatus Omnitrophota bacterium]